MATEIKEEKYLPVDKKDEFFSYHDSTAIKMAHIGVFKSPCVTVTNELEKLLPIKQ